MEQWRPIKGYEDSYVISDHGRIKSLPREVKKNGGTRIMGGNILEPNTTIKNLRVNLSVNSNHDIRYVHRLVAETFIPNPENHTYVVFIDGDQLNVSANNLKWGKRARGRPIKYKTNFIIPSINPPDLGIVRCRKVPNNGSWLSGFQVGTPYYYRFDKNKKIYQHRFTIFKDLDMSYPIQCSDSLFFKHFQVV